MRITNIKTVGHEIRRQDKRSKTRIYIWPEGENIMQNLANRQDRPQAAWKPFAERVAHIMGVDFEKIGWSQKAGCSCGCSPGFVVKGDCRPGFDIHVTLEA